MRAALPTLVLLLSAAAAFGLDAGEQMRFADGIYLRGFYETAAGEYLVLLRDHPGSPHEAAALYRIGECYRQLGNQTGAERFYKRVAAEFPGSPQAPRAALRRAELAVAAGRHAEAAELLNQLLMEAPSAENAAAASYYLGYSRWQAGDKRGARAAYERMLAEHGASPYAAYAALDLAAMLGETKGAADDMQAWFEKAVAVAATPAVKAEALYRWGDWAYRQGQYQLAADTLQTLMVELPDEPRAREARLAAAWSLFYLDRAADVLPLAEQLAADAPTAETAAAGIYLRANCLRKLNRDGEALGDYERVVREFPATGFAGRAAYEIMVTHFKRGDHEQALLAAPPRPDPAQEADVLWMRAECERALGRAEQARTRYETLVRDFPKAAPAVPALLRLGEMAREAGRLEEAVGWFHRVADDYPKDPAVPEALKAAALARVQTGDRAGALADWDALLDRRLEPPAAAEAGLQKAMVLIELKKAGEALAVLDELLKAVPEGETAARAHYWRGVLLADKEKWPEAEAALRASLALAPDGAGAALARLRLAVVLQRQDRMDEAADQFEPLLENPVLAADHPAMAEWFVRHRFDQGAFAAARRAGTVLGESARESAWRQIGWYWAGAAEAQLGNDAKAMSCYEKAVLEEAGTREGAEAQLLLAGLELKAGRPAQAAERFAAAAEAAGAEADLGLRVRAYFGLGEAAEAAGQPEKAARHFRSVAVLFDDPEWTPHSLYRAGLLFGQTGRRAEQEDAWNELKQRYPDSSFAKQLETPSP